jgi:hypothetical protein
MLRVRWYTARGEMIPERASFSNIWEPESVQRIGIVEKYSGYGDNGSIFREFFTAYKLYKNLGEAETSA